MHGSICHILPDTIPCLTYELSAHEKLVPPELAAIDSLEE